MIAGPRGLLVVSPFVGRVSIVIVRIVRMMVVVVVVMMMIIGAAVIIVVMMMMRVIVILRQSYIWFPFGFRLGACGVRLVNGLEQGNRIRDRLEQLRIGSRIHNFGFALHQRG